ncbi:MAG: hypothetical protein H6722_13005 [Sandaracinus sp.]|nr:hypothetical protein [Sandaracinus sp.]MCB9613361.1 hypothetical protein [Sandaracinus sp.]MCB9625185.1 hypothetical protein [Sandaracinus sp.]
MRSFALSFVLLVGSAPTLAQDKPDVRIERLRRALEADPDDVDARVRLVEEVDALGPPWSTDHLMTELSYSAPRGVRAWAHRRRAERWEASGRIDEAVWHSWRAQLWSGRPEARLSRLFTPDHRFFFLSATTPEPLPALVGAECTVQEAWTLGTVRIELRAVRTDLFHDSLVLVAIDASGSENAVGWIGDQWSNAGDSTWTTVDRAQLRNVEGRPQVVLEGEVSSTNFDECSFFDRRDRFTAVCEPKSEGRPGGCVRWTIPGSISSGLHHQFSDAECDPAPRFRALPVPLGRVEVGRRGIRWRGPASVPWLRSWRSLDAQRVGARALPRSIDQPWRDDAPLPPRLPIDPPSEIKVEVRESTPEEALHVFEQLFDANE